MVIQFVQVLAGREDGVATSKLLTGGTVELSRYLVIERSCLFAGGGKIYITKISHVPMYTSVALRTFTLL